MPKPIYILLKALYVAIGIGVSFNVMRILSPANR